MQIFDQQLFVCGRTGRRSRGRSAVLPTHL